MILQFFFASSIIVKIIIVLLPLPIKSWFDINVVLWGLGPSAESRAPNLHFTRDLNGVILHGPILHNIIANLT